MAGSVHTEAYSDLLAALVGARNQASLSQAQLATKLGKPASFVGKYELGERRLDVIELLIVLKALDVPIELFLAGLQTKVPEKL